MIAWRAFGFACLSVLFAPCDSSLAQTERTSKIADSTRNLSSDVVSGALREQCKGQTWRNLQARGDMANQRDVANWKAIRTRDDWEQLRGARLERLRMALGAFPDQPKSLATHVTSTVEGDSYVIENLIYRTRPDFWVTANLYAPSQPIKRMPGILIAHSHHRPKTQGELQDMGMTWARKGCVVLVIDQVGHGERADHPFQSESDFKKKDAGYQWWRQDYYYRFDTNVQLHLASQSLMGWMVWDLMRGVDLLLAHPGVDRDKIIILGAVAGGGDPAAVTAALDRRIAAAVPFNFGGPQPETRFPLPDDVDLHFDYLGGAYWEGTRNLRRTGADGFFHWSIVASIAPRGLIYAHEFAWDQDHDPVWKRLKRIYEFYDAVDKIDYTLGRGSVKGHPPEATHCTNIGHHHRQRIHPAFKRWFGINVAPNDEYSQRLESEALRSMSDKARREFKPRKLFQILTDVGREQVNAARDRLASQSLDGRRKQLRSDWRQLLGDIQPRDGAKVISRSIESMADNAIVVERIALRAESDIVVPMILMYADQDESRPSRTVVAISQEGKEKFLRERSQEIADLLERGAVVCLPDLRGASTARGSRGEGEDSASYYALFFETPMLGYRLRDLRSVLEYLRTRGDINSREFSLWGDSFTPPNAKDTDFQVPKRVSGRPRFSEPLGGLLAMLGALYEDDVKAVYLHGGLSGYRDVLTGPYVYIPHDVVVPGALSKGDLADLAAALAPRPLRLEGVVDGLNRTLPLDEVRSAYEPAIDAYERIDPQAISFSTNRSNPTRWLLGANADQ